MTEEHFTKTVIPFERPETFRSKDIHIVFNVDVTGGDYVFRKGLPLAVRASLHVYSFCT